MKCTFSLDVSQNIISVMVSKLNNPILINTRMVNILGHFRVGSSEKVFAIF